MNAARRFTLAALASLCALTGLLLASAPALALNVHTFSGSFGKEGSENGQLEQPDGVAVNDQTHDVYVVDRGNNRVEEFTSAGAYIGQFNGSASPTGAFDEPTWVAVDNSGNLLDPSAGDVYVIDRGHGVIDKFNAAGVYEGQLTTGAGDVPFAERLYGVAVDPAGVVWVLQQAPPAEEAEGNLVIDSFSDASDNLFLASNMHFHTLPEPGLAVDSEDRLYFPKPFGGVNMSEAGRLYEFPAIGRDIGNVSGLAVDSSNNEVYADLGEQVKAYAVNKLFIEQFGSGHLTGGSGIAVDSSSHVVYVADAATDRVAIFDQVVLPDVSTGLEQTNEEHEGSVTLNGMVNPDGEQVTSCQFEYGIEASYSNVAPCEPAAGSGSSPVAVHANVTGLTPLTSYHYRLVAGNANGSNPGFDETFTAPERPKIDDESVAGVTSSSAELEVELNPGGAETTYRFEYGPTTAYGTSLSGDASAGTGDTALRAQLRDLRPNTAYHYRIVAGNAVQREVIGPDRTFTTQSAGSEFALPDGRAWELVTPPNKDGSGLIAVGNEQGADIQASTAGDAITYGAITPFVANPASSRAPEVEQMISKRTTPGSWATRDITTPHREVIEIAINHTAEYKLFSTELSVGFVEPVGDTPLPPLPPSAEKTLYFRKASGEYEALVSTANVAPGTEFGGDPRNPNGGALKFITATPDMSRVLLQSAVGLTEGDGAGLYEWAAGKLRFVGEGTAGSQDENVRHAISNDGSRVVFGGAERHLYLRDMATGAIVQVDAAQGAPEPPPSQSNSRYRTANNEDSRVFFTSEERLTGDSTASAGKEDLYEFETSGAGKPLAGKLTDLTVDGNTGESADVRGVIGASEDGSSVYFVANGVLGDGRERGAESGECERPEKQLTATCTLYVEHYDQGTEAWTAPTFVATLSNADRPSWGGGSSVIATVTDNLTTMTSRVSPNGRYLAFMSENSLTGYDSRDANSGAPDEEVFLYDAATAKLVCASCNPTGTRPVGLFEGNEYEERLVDYAVNWKERWLAGNIPGWTSTDDFHALYQSRYLSNSGRLFFNSADALVPADVNGKEDVYEYEPLGVGTCQGAGDGQSASVVFSESAGGCTALISAGTSAEESAFLDASEAGGDVFFLTKSRLAPADYDASIDVYDAHECTALALCPPPLALTPPPCTTGDACKAAPTPQPAIYGAPSSETFSGAGNVVLSAPESKTVEPKSAARGQQLAKALQACKRKRKQRRGACESQARKRYGAKGSRVRRSLFAGIGNTANKGAGR
jgi:DNA-binding beta-propeller fold protein YncE